MAKRHTGTMRALVPDDRAEYVQTIATDYDIDLNDPCLLLGYAGWCGVLFLAMADPVIKDLPVAMVDELIRYARTGDRQGR